MRACAFPTSATSQAIQATIRFAPPAARSSSHGRGSRCKRITYRTGRAPTAASPFLASGGLENQKASPCRYHPDRQISDSISVTVDGGQWDAEACFAESARIFTEMNTEGELARTLRAWAEYEIKRENRARGETMWQEAKDLFARLGMELEVERMADKPRPEDR